jgi:hypothetical protein
MQQILKFTLEIFDVRTKTSIKISDDTELVRSIQITKDLQLNNQAVISFAKTRSYKLLKLEETMKLYNYVKIELELKNSNPSNLKPDKDGKISGELFYFSGFIQDVDKQTSYGQAPSSLTMITIVDFANLFKTTFYTKNLTFLDILNQAVPEFRLLNFSEIFNDPNNKLLNDFYSVNQIGFIFFSFFFFKFLYSIVYDKPGEDKMASGEKIFKQFKIFMPFGFDIPAEAVDDKTQLKSMFKSQVSSLIIYKQLQGVALDLFKYLYPEPLFEFSTYETVDSVILQIRPTPFMSFDRILKGKTNISYSNVDIPGMSQTETLDLQGSVTDVETFKVINRGDFGHTRMGLIEAKSGNLPIKYLKEHLDPIVKTMNATVTQSKKLNVESFIPSEQECRLLIKNFFNEITFDIRFIESISMKRTAQSVVNVIWTTPVTDTAVLKTSGRSLVYGLLYDKLAESGAGQAAFKKYIAEQFVKNKDVNPVFLMNYQNMFPDNYVSGDLNYFGFREFEIKWNCLTFYDSTAYHVLNYVDRKILKAVRDASQDSKVMKIADTALQNNTQKIDSNTKKNPKKNVRNEVPPKKIGVFYANAFEDANFLAACKQFDFDPKEWKEADLPAFLLKLKNSGSGSLGVFVAQLNGIAAQAYRENEHLYDCRILKPIDLSILPGMIVNSDFPNNPRFNKPRFKGYVTAVSHSIDFNASTMKSNFTLTRTASDDSALTVQAN